MNPKYSISDAAKTLGLSSEMLRYYERQGILTPERAGNGYRYFSSKDIGLLIGARRLQGMGYTVEEVEFLLNTASLEQVQEMLEKAEEKIIKEIRWQQLVMSSIKKQHGYFERLKSPGDKYTLRTSSPIYRLDFQHNTLVLLEENKISNLDRWVSLLPVVEISPEFTLDAIYNGLDQCNWGLMISEALAEEFGLTGTPGAVLIPAQQCLTTIISSEGPGHIMASMISDVVGYAESIGMTVSGKAWGYTIGSFTQDKVDSRYHEIYIPVKAKV